MAATLAEIRAGLVANLASVGDAQPYVLDTPPVPCLQIDRVSLIDYDQAYQRGLDYWTLIVRGYVGTQFDIAAQVLLDEWISSTGATSVKAAVESDRTLGGKVQDLTVRTCSGYGYYDLPNHGRTLGAEWTILILNTGH